MAVARRIDAGTVQFLQGMGRAAAGALIFSLPMFMTMEMWWLGFDMPPARLALMMLLTLPMLVALSRFGGLRPTARLRDDVADAVIAILVAAVTASASLLLMGLLTHRLDPEEIVGRVMVQTVPASLGAMLARSQLAAGGASDGAPPGYWGEIFLMGVGGLFLSFNLAPTQEIPLIADKIGIGREIALALISLLAMHAFVYAVSFRGGASRHEGVSFISVLARYSLVGYVVVLAVSLYALWSFGRTEGASLSGILGIAIVLSFPGAVGAAAGRLIL